MALTAESYTGLLRSLMPKGRAWRVSEGVQGGILAGLAEELARVDAKATALLEAESWPGTASDLLTDWETELGLPEACAPLAATEAGRQAVAAEKMTRQGSLSKRALIALAEAHGYTVDIGVYPVATCESPCDAALNPVVIGAPCTAACDAPLEEELWPHAFYVDVSAAVTPAEATCESPSDAALRTWALPIECVINSARSSETVAIFKYLEDVEFMGSAVILPDEWTGDGYAARTTSDGHRVVELALRNTFDHPGGRSVALADSEYGWEWVNRGEVVSATENDADDGVLEVTTDGATNVLWDVNFRTATLRRHADIYFATYGRSEFFAASVNPDGLTASNELTGLLVHEEGAEQRFFKCVARGNGVVWAHTNTADEVDVSSEITSESWLWVGLKVSSQGVYGYCVDSDTPTPPPLSEWRLLGGDEIFGQRQAYYRVALLLDHGGVECVHKVRGLWRLSEPAEPGLPFWGATLLDVPANMAAAPVCTYEVDLKLGSVTAADLINAFKAAQGRVPSWGASMEFGARLSATSPTPAVSTFSALDDLTIDGTGRYLRLSWRVLTDSKTTNGLGTVHIPVR